MIYIFTFPSHLINRVVFLFFFGGSLWFISAHKANQNIKRIKSTAEERQAGKKERGRGVGERRSEGEAVAPSCSWSFESRPPQQEGVQQPWADRRRGRQNRCVSASDGHTCCFLCNNCPCANSSDVLLCVQALGCVCVSLLLLILDLVKYLLRLRSAPAPSPDPARDKAGKRKSQCCISKTITSVYHLMLLLFNMSVCFYQNSSES